MRLTRADVQGAVAVTDGRAADDHRRPCRRKDAGSAAACLMSIQPSGPGEDVIFTDPGLSQDLRPLVRARRKAGFLMCRPSQFLRAGRLAGNACRRAAAMANAVAVNRDVAQAGHLRRCFQDETASQRARGDADLIDGGQHGGRNLRAEGPGASIRAVLRSVGAPPNAVPQSATAASSASRLCTFRPRASMAVATRAKAARSGSPARDRWRICVRCRFLITVSRIGPWLVVMRWRRLRPWRGPGGASRGRSWPRSAPAACPGL